MESESDADAINDELLNKIFQGMAQLTKSVISINDRLERIESTTGRLQARLANLNSKYTRKVLAIDNESENK